MNRTEKQNVIDELKGKFEASPNFYFADTSGLTVADINKLRRLCHKEGIEMRVSKNTFIRKALEAKGGEYGDLFNALHGSTSILFSENPNAPAKLIKAFRKSSEKPSLKAAYIEAAVFLGDNQIETLIKLKSKNELIGDIIGSLQAPAKNVISALLSGGQKLGGIIKSLSERPEN